MSEYWVVDLAAGQVFVHRLGEEGYPAPAVLKGSATLEPSPTPGLVFSVAALLG